MRSRSTWTVSRYSSRLGPSNHGVRSLRVMTLSPCSALSGIACSVAPCSRSSKSSQMASKTPRSKSTRSILLMASTKFEMPSSRGDPRVPLGLHANAVPRVDEQDGEIRGGRARCHVAGVLLVPGRISQDELAPRGREVPIRDVDRDALLALGLQAIGEQREVDRPGAAILGSGFNRADLILVHRARIVQQPSDQRALPVVDAAGRADSQEARFHAPDSWFRHQKYPSRFFNSIEPS